MKRINVQKDVESRQRIAVASPKVLPTEKVTESINPEIMQQNGKTTEVPGDENHPTAATGPTAPAKRGRKTNGDVQKV